MKYEYLIGYLYIGKNKQLRSGMQLITTYNKINSVERVKEIRNDLQETNKQDTKKGTNVIIINIQLLRKVKE